MYSLQRTDPPDGAGDAGLMCHKIRWDDEKQEGIELPCDYPQVGWCIKVGSHHARAMCAQDWWRTSPITEILTETVEGIYRVVTFKTGNSEYQWKGLTRSI